MGVKKTELTGSKAVIPNLSTVASMTISSLFGYKRRATTLTTPENYSMLTPWETMIDHM